MIPLAGIWTMDVGFTPTQTVLVTLRVETAIVLIEPVLGQAEFVPELITYIELFCAELTNTGWDPGSKAMVVMAPARIGRYSLTVSLPLLAMKRASEFGGKASAMEPTPMELTATLVSPDTSI